MSISKSKPKSIFDNLSPKTEFTFTKPQPHHRSSINTAPKIIGSLTCTDLTNSNKIKGIFSIHHTLLAFFDEDCFNISKVLDLTYARLTFILGLVVSKDGREYRLEFADKQSQKKWVSVLKRICIMTNLHDRYSTIKTIGKGNFSKVFLVESRTDGKFYAAKTFTKSFIELGEDGEMMVTFYFSRLFFHFSSSRLNN